MYDRPWCEDLLHTLLPVVEEEVFKDLQPIEEETRTYWKSLADGICFRFFASVAAKLAAEKGVSGDMIQFHVLKNPLDFNFFRDIFMINRICRYIRFSLICCNVDKVYF